MRALLVIVAMGIAGCAAPFRELDPAERNVDGVHVGYCGSSKVTAGGVLKAMDGPPSGPTDEQQPASDVSVCVSVRNQSDTPVRIDRSHLRLQTSLASVSYTPDKDDDVLVVPPGESREVHVTFQPGALASGEDVKLVVSEALTMHQHPLKVAAFKLRKQ